MSHELLVVDTGLPPLISVISATPPSNKQTVVNTVLKVMKEREVNVKEELVLISKRSDTYVQP